MVKKISIYFLFLTPFFLFSCAPPQRMGQAAIKNFETRTVNASFDQVYAAATEALFDLGYTIQHTDKETGILVGEKRQKKVVFTVFGMEFGEEDEEGQERYETLQLTLFIQRIDSQTTKVRIKTAVEKEPKLDREAINEVWVYIQRQILMEGGPSKKEREEKLEEKSEEKK